MYIVLVGDLGSLPIRWDFHPSARHLLGSEPMDGLVLGFYLLAALLGGFVSGFSGFAMNMAYSSCR